MMNANGGGYNPSMRPPNVARDLFPNPNQVPHSQFFPSPISQPYGMYPQGDVECVPETQPDSMPKPSARRQKGAATGSAQGKRNVQWSEDEDLVLLRCYYDVCMDPIVGTNQKYATLFHKIKEKYDNARRDAMYSDINERTQDSLRKRVDRIKAEVNQWLPAYETATKEVGQRSGRNEEDVLKVAQALFKQNSKYNADFSMFKQWDLMKKFPEYERYLNWEKNINNKDVQAVDLDLEDGGSNQRESTGGSSGTKRFRVVDDSVSSPQRPMGRDKAKRMAKSSTSLNSDSMEVISHVWSTFNDNYSKQVEMEGKRMELEAAREARKAEMQSVKEARRAELQLAKEARKAKKEARLCRELAVREEAQLERKRDRFFELYQNYHNLNAPQKAYVDQLRAELGFDD